MSRKCVHEALAAVSVAARRGPSQWHRRAPRADELIAWATAAAQQAEINLERWPDIGIESLALCLCREAGALASGVLRYGAVGDRDDYRRIRECINETALQIAALCLQVACWAMAHGGEEAEDG